jgi:hypothetical protein
MSNWNAIQEESTKTTAKKSLESLVRNVEALKGIIQMAVP